MSKYSVEILTPSGDALAKPRTYHCDSYEIKSVTLTLYGAKVNRYAEGWKEEGTVVLFNLPVRITEI